MKQPGKGGSPVSQLSMNLVFQTGISVVTKGVPGGGGALCSRAPTVFSYLFSV